MLFERGDEERGDMIYIRCRGCFTGRTLYDNSVACRGFKQAYVQGWQVTISVIGARLTPGKWAPASTCSRTFFILHGTQASRLHLGQLGFLSARGLVKQQNTISVFFAKALRQVARPTHSFWAQRRSAGCHLWPGGVQLDGPTACATAPPRCYHQYPR